MTDHLDASWHRELLKDLCSGPRATATEGERWLPVVKVLTPTSAPGTPGAVVATGRFGPWKRWA